MVTLIEEGTDRVPPPPKGFPQCHSWDWDGKDFSQYVYGKKKKNQGFRKTNIRRDRVLNRTLSDFTQKDDSVGFFKFFEFFLQQTLSKLGK